MKRNFSKYAFTFGLLLACILFVPTIVSNFTIISSASTVDDKKPSVRLNLKSKSIVKGKDFSIKIYNLPQKAKVTYKSSDSDIASVDSAGLITANKVGNAIITVTVKSASTTSSLTCDVTVGPPAVSVKSNKSRIILALNQSDILKLILKPSNTAEDAKFSSYDYNIATISSGGRITSRALGHTYVFAEIGDVADGTRRYATCSIIIVGEDDIDSYTKYFDETPELNRIPESHLNKALDNYFNSEGYKSATSLNIYLKTIFDFQLLASTDEVLPSNLYKIQLKNTLYN
ncbi:MAG TPA: hypothetical protein GXZ90_08070 [Clostridiales bacterium]|nr:hypothetical protein [Clostridiales bacterium]